MKWRDNDVKVAVLQETRWFRSEVYEVGESLLLTAGREGPLLVIVCREGKE